MTKALGLFSGGLDSILATAIIREQGISVVVVNFKTPVFGPEKAIKSAQLLNIPLKIVDITSPFLEILRNPEHGYGSFMNPCIDCHILMLQEAGKIMEGEGFDFIFTGEVLGQRPMSQNKGTLKLIARKSGYHAHLLRPLSAKLLPETIPEKMGQVDRDSLLDISGRSRKRQMALAQRLGISEYPTPSGGCLLTDPGFSRRLKDLLQYLVNVDNQDIELLKWGRHLRLDKDTKLIIGRNKKENDAIHGLSKPQDQVLKTLNVPGPAVLIPCGTHLQNQKLAATICASYSDALEGTPVRVMVTQNHISTIISTKAVDKRSFKNLLI
ncbi:MAG TPA: DUF814 domain-containing protein [Syntrophaceae bacterium]|nr:DUF814 domain-containing protein [Syntrophaceae bacterium]